jgi:choice-of-anchor A domain-containing protein
MMIRCVALAVVAGLPLAARASVLSDWNLIVRNSVVSSSEVDGSAIIGGSLTGASNFAVQGVTAPGNLGLSVGGAVGGGPVSVNNAGNFRYGGALNTIVNVNGGTSTFDAGAAAAAAAAHAQGVAISSYLSGLTPNGTLDGAGNLNATPTLIGGRLVAVYSITPAQWSSLGQLNLNIGLAQSVVINVPTGGNISFVAPPNLLGGFTLGNSSRIIWNLPTAASVTVNNTFNGALLAPAADLRVLGGGINGSVVVDSVSIQDAEIRRFTYTGFIPSPGAGGLLGIAGLLAARRRR